MIASDAGTVFKICERVAKKLVDILNGNVSLHILSPQYFQRKLIRASAIRLKTLFVTLSPSY